LSVVVCRVFEDKIEFAADSILVWGWTQRTDIKTSAKLFEINEMIVGGAGYAQELSLFKLFCRNHRPASAEEVDIVSFMTEFSGWKEKQMGNQNISNSYLLGFRGYAF